MKSPAHPARTVPGIRPSRRRVPIVPWIVSLHESTDRQPDCQPDGQCQQAFGIHHPVGAADVLRLNGPQRVADGGFVIIFAKVAGGPRQLDAQSPGAGAFGLGAVGAGMVPAVPPPDLPRARSAVPGKRRRSGPEQPGDPAGQIVRRIIQFGGGAAEIKIFLVFVAEHAVHRVDGLVGQGQRGTAQQHIEQRRDDAVAGVFGYVLFTQMIVLRE